MSTISPAFQTNRQFSSGIAVRQPQNSAPSPINQGISPEAYAKTGMVFGGLMGLLGGVATTAISLRYGGKIDEKLIRVGLATTVGYTLAAGLGGLAFANLYNYFLRKEKAQ